MDSITIERIIKWEANELDQMQSLAMVSVLMKTDDLWILKGKAGEVACILMMIEETNVSN
jgi:hypothetical protein